MCVCGDTIGECFWENQGREDMQRWYDGIPSGWRKRPAGRCLTLQTGRWAPLRRSPPLPPPREEESAVLWPASLSLRPERRKIRSRAPWCLRWVGEAAPCCSGRGCPRPPVSGAEDRINSVKGRGAAVPPSSDQSCTVAFPTRPPALSRTRTTLTVESGLLTVMRLSLTKRTRPLGESLLAMVTLATCWGPTTAPPVAPTSSTSKVSASSLGRINPTLNEIKHWPLSVWLTRYLSPLPLLPVWIIYDGHIDVTGILTVLKFQRAISEDVVQVRGRVQASGEELGGDLSVWAHPPDHRQQHRAHILLHWKTKEPKSNRCRETLVSIRVSSTQEQMPRWCNIIQRVILSAQS